MHRRAHDKDMISFIQNTKVHNNGMTEKTLPVNTFQRAPPSFYTANFILDVTDSKPRSDSVTKIKCV